MSLFDKIKGPVFVKEDSSARQQLDALTLLRKDASGELADQLDEEICRLNAGIFGEETVRFELENSHIPMLVLHDLYLEHDGLTAQIDYLIITRKHFFVVECKNLYGNLEIDHLGSFTRTVKYGKRTKKEGIYSPITQNRRHLELIRAIRGEAQPNLISKMLFEKDFDRNYKSIVVLSNPKTVLYDRYATKEIKSQVIRADRLSEYIRTEDKNDSRISRSEKEMVALGEFFLKLHHPSEIDYTEKYRVRLEEQKKLAAEQPAQRPVSDSSEPQVMCPRCGAPMVKRTAGKGPYAGKVFYGCSRYPHCKGIVNLK